jgi:hypothetical protein
MYNKYYPSRRWHQSERVGRVQSGRDRLAVSAVLEIGGVQPGQAPVRAVVVFADPLHLYFDETEPRTGRHLGNFLQALTHLALINVVMQQGPQSGPARSTREWSCRSSAACCT